MTRSRLVCVLLALVTLLVYLPVRRDAFVNYDDPDYVTENPVVQAGLTWAGVKWAFTTLDASNWHPLTWLSHMLDCQLFGLSAGRHHLVSVLLHATNAVLLFVLFLRMTGAFWQSAFIAALFAWHPLHVESVAWVAERKDVLSAFFGLLTLIAYVRYAQKRGPETGNGKSAKAAAINYSLALFFFALGLMAKPMLVTLPFVFLLLDYWPLRRVTSGGRRVTGDQKPAGKLSALNSSAFTSGRGATAPKRSEGGQLSILFLEKLPLFALAVASCVMTFVAQKHGESVASLEAYPLYSRIENAAVVYVKYLSHTVYPANLAVIYPLPREVPLVQAAGAVVVLATISWVIWRVRRQRPYLLTGWLWYLGMLVPVIGLVQVGSQAMADRYTYLPLIGVFLGATFGMGDLAVRLRLKSTILILVAVIVLAGCLFATARQLRFWRDGETLFEHALAETKDNPVAHNELGSTLLQEGNVDEAITHFQKALQISPDNAVAHNNLGNALLRKGSVDEAITHFQKALQIKPDYAAADNNLGIALLRKGSVDEAIVYYQKALQIKPDYAEAHYNLGNALLRKGNVDEAIVHYQEALQIKSDSAEAYNNLGNALLRKGSVDEAITHYQEALQIKPDYAEAHYNLGNTLFRKGSVDEAIVQYQKVLQIKPDSAEVHNNLGSALLKRGNVQEAIHQYLRALEIDPDFAGAENNLAWVLATCPQALLRDGNKAVELAQRANQLTREGNPVFLDTLAAAYAEVGRFPEAVTTARQALQLAIHQNNTAIVNALQAQIGCYEAGVPFRDLSLTNTPPAESRP